MFGKAKCPECGKLRKLDPVWCQECNDKLANWVEEQHEENVLEAFSNWYQDVTGLDEEGTKELMEELTLEEMEIFLIENGAAKEFD